MKEFKSELLIRRKPSKKETRGEQSLPDRAGTLPGSAPYFSSDHALAGAASSTGSPLPDNIANKFEESLGTDLSRVRVHADAGSSVAADAIGARAYAVGQDIHFGTGQYDPSSREGERLLAHEVAHTVQQSGAEKPAMSKLEVSTPGDRQEVEADAAADAMIDGREASVSSATSRVMGSFLERERARGRQAVVEETTPSEGEGQATEGDTQSFEAQVEEVVNAVRTRLSEPPPADAFTEQGDEPWVGEVVEHLTGLPYAATAQHPGDRGRHLPGSGECNELGGAIQRIRGLRGYDIAPLPSHYSYYLGRGAIHVGAEGIGESETEGLQPGATIFHLENNPNDHQPNHQMPRGACRQAPWVVTHENTVIRVAMGDENGPLNPQQRQTGEQSDQEGGGETAQTPDAQSRRIKWIQIFDTPRLGEGRTLWSGYTLRPRGETLLNTERPNHLAQESG